MLKPIFDECISEIDITDISYTDIDTFFRTAMVIVMIVMVEHGYIECSEIITAFEFFLLQCQYIMYQLVSIFIYGDHILSLTFFMMKSLNSVSVPTNSIHDSVSRKR
ncbi:MAG: hypothetical protein ACLUQK_06955 [Clostridium sp.]